MSTPRLGSHELLPTRHELADEDFSSDGVDLGDGRGDAALPRAAIETTTTVSTELQKLRQLIQHECMTLLIQGVEDSRLTTAFKSLVCIRS
jgi:hypothetical protein